MIVNLIRLHLVQRLRMFNKQKCCNACIIPYIDLSQKRAIYNNTKLIFSKTKIDLFRCITSSHQTVCWQCKQYANFINKLFCEHCNTLRKPNIDENHFNILSVDQVYDQDLLELSRKYKNLQKFLHPDKFTNRSPDEQKVSLEWSAQVNRSYSVLSHPLNRAEYLLQMHDISIPEESDTKDISFLMEMMEKNEEIDDISTADDALKALQSIQGSVKEFGIKLGEAVEAKQLDTALLILRKMKYYYSLEQNIKKKVTQLGAVAE